MDAEKLINDTRDTLRTLSRNVPGGSPERAQAEKVLGQWDSVMQPKVRLNYASAQDVIEMTRAEQEACASLIRFSVMVARSAHELNNNVKIVKDALDGLRQAAPDLFKELADFTNDVREQNNWPKNPGRKEADQ